MRSSRDRLILLVVAAATRVVALSVADGYAPEGDESSYLAAGFGLLRDGTQDDFWPPLTGWLIAALGAVLGERVLLLRAAVCAIDVGNVALVHALASRSALGRTDEARRRIAFFAGLAYALYLPAIGFATSMTSEVPTVTLLLGALLSFSETRRPPLTDASGAALLGLATLARTNLLLLPFAIAFALPGRSSRARVGIVVLATAIPLGWVARNALVTGEVFLSTNASYNLYIGNAPEAQQELDLFAPSATESQRALRSGGDYEDAEIARSLPNRVRSAHAIGFIREAPLRFVRRSIGRLARTFAPKTAQLSLVGGSRAGPETRRAQLLLLGVGFLQWCPVLFGGLLGLAHLLERRAPGGAPFVATVVGSLPLCLIAISKPRYAFPFEPLLLIGLATAVVGRVRLLDLGVPYRRALGVTFAFLIWGIIAWFVFAFTSRT